MTTERTTRSDESKCTPSNGSRSQPANADSPDSLPPSTGGTGPTTALPDSVAEQRPDGLYPVLPLPTTTASTKPRDAVVFPYAIKLLEYTAWQREHARLILQHLRNVPKPLVVLMDEDTATQTPIPSETADGAPQLQPSVLAEVVDFEVLEAQGEGEDDTLVPMHPNRDRDRWIELGSTAASRGGPPTREELDELEKLSVRVRAVRVLVQGICRAECSPAIDVSRPESGTESGEGQEGGEPPAIPDSSSLAMVRTRALSNTLGADSLEDDAAEVEALEATLGEDARQSRRVNPKVDSRLEHLTEILTEYFNQLAIRDWYWCGRLTPLWLGPAGPTLPAAQIENMADQLLCQSAQDRRQWLQRADIGERVIEVFQIIHACRNEPPQERRNRVAQENEQLRKEKMERRQKHWTPAWRDRVENLSDPTDVNGMPVFVRQRFYSEAPQKSDMQEPVDVDRATLLSIFDQHLYGLQKVKDEIIDHLIFQLHSPGESIRPLCLVGPPGVGKTSFARAVAQATGRRFAEIPTGGATGASDLQGTNRTWSRPRVGTLIQTMCKVGEFNPVLLLDEIDKVNQGGERSGGGDPATSLLEILDPERNREFVDQMMELPYDLSHVLFIATANVAGEISEPLRDRMTIVRIPGYTEDEKFAIAREHMIPHLESVLHLREGDVIFPDDVLRHVIHKFCPSEGVRELRERLQRLYAFALEKGHKRIGRALQEQVHIDIKSATRVLSKLGKEAFWSRPWTDLLNSLKKEEEEKRRYLRELPQPCDIISTTEIDLTFARKAMDASHYGLDQVKELILDYLGMERRTGRMRSKPICLIGPPGVGKTSLCESIAKATHREFEKIRAVGSISEQELRGSPFAPGQILKAMYKVKTFNPVILLDEIDKGKDGGPGGTQAALLEILDPEQNTQFLDHFLTVPYSLAGVLFIASANYEEGIPPELRDRFHVIRIPDYSTDEKRTIARDYLIPRVLADSGLAEHIVFTDDAVELILQRCAGSAGIRALEEAIGDIANRLGRSITSDGEGQQMQVGAEKAHEVLEQTDSQSTSIGFDIAQKGKAPSGAEDQRGE